MRPTDEFSLRARRRVSALYLAANGCDVTTLTPESEALERVMQAAIGAGLAGRVHALIGDLSSWTPEAPLNAVIVNPAAFDAMSAAERGESSTLLQGATMDGGVHLVQTIPAGRKVEWRACRSRSSGASTAAGSHSRTRRRTRAKTFLARKGAA